MMGRAAGAQALLGVLCACKLMRLARHEGCACARRARGLHVVVCAWHVHYMYMCMYSACATVQ